MTSGGPPGMRIVFDRGIPSMANTPESDIDDKDLVTVIMRIQPLMVNTGLYTLQSAYDPSAFMLVYGVVICKITLWQLYDICVRYPWVIEVRVDDDTPLPISRL